MGDKACHTARKFCVHLNRPSEFAWMRPTEKVGRFGSRCLQISLQNESCWSLMLWMILKIFPARKGREPCETRELIEDPTCLKKPPSHLNTPGEPPAPSVAVL